jgi:hypothetical protein
MIVFWHAACRTRRANFSNEKKLRKDLGGTAFVLPPVVD